MTHAVRTAAQAAQDAVVFKALANPVRLQIVSLVAAAPQGQVSAGEIVDSFELSQPTISHHLRVLREAGVLTTHKASTFVYYRFAPRLHEVVTSVLPNAAAVEPPSDPPARPVRRGAADSRDSGEPEGSSHEETRDVDVAAPVDPAEDAISESAQEETAEAPSPAEETLPKAKEKKSKKGKKAKKAKGK